MRDHRFVFLFVFHYVGFANSGYPPMGDEVQAGSVLLPATRRGRYLANIVRRQAVDGTGIKFNKDADRMNAEAKKKVDVLSEELLPYIIAEQERRTTLYKRVMTAIQNGEKGVTVAEIRNKPPAIIRKGLMYRCPTNRAPREPDGSGAIMCEDNLDPTPIMFESCLSAEDKELYVADNKYFFCNRHKVEGPDLPRNGTSVIGCAPCERTSLNYTSQKCALEDTDDVVVHYRYYPDRTYKFVSELDPDREVCEHWNPCQVGYIFSLPGPDQATPASELWHDYSGDTDEEISREEIIPPVPEDDKNETTYPANNYVTSTRRVMIPAGYEYHGVGKYMPNGLRTRVSRRDGTVDNFDNIEVISEVMDIYIKITMVFRPMRPEDATTYYVRFQETARKGNFVHVPLVTLSMGQTRLTPQVLQVVPAQHLNITDIYFTCARCVLRGIMLRATDGTVSNVDVEKYRLRKFNDEKGVEQSVIEMDFELVTPRDFGDYFLMIQNDDGGEERIKALTLTAPDTDHNNAIQVKRKRKSAGVGMQFSTSMTYTCNDCELTDVLCRGESVTSKGHVTLIPTSKSVNFNFAGFEDTNTCVYMGVFKIGDAIYRKIVAIIENDSPVITIEGGAKLLSPPAEGASIEHSVYYKCSSECSLTKVNVNGIPLETTTRRSNVGSVAYYLPENTFVTIGVTEYNSAYEGMFQGVFLMDGEEITKNLMELGSQNHTEPESEAAPDEELTTEAEAGGEGNPEARSEHQPPTGTRRSGGTTEQSCAVDILRDSVPAGRAYKQKTVGYACPGGQLVAVSCRGQHVTAGLAISSNDTVNIDFDHFEDTNACVYMGIFKIGQTEHRKTLAVIENSSPMINVSVSAVVPPPPSGELKHKVVYTCDVAQCDPAMIYINDRTLKSDDKPLSYSYKSEMVKENDKEVMTVTINFTIKPFTKEYEGVYQLVVSNGAERVTKNIMEIGALA